MSAWVKNNFWLFFFGIFALVGTVMGIVAATVWLNASARIREGVRTEGRVVDLLRSGKGSYSPVIEFETESGQTQTYTSGISSSPPAYRPGETVTLWYDPERPDRVVVAGLDRWLLPAIFGGFFIVFGGLGYGGLLYQLWRGRKKKWLFENGRKVEASIVEVGRKTSVRANGVSPFVVLSQWHDPIDNRVYTFESDYIWFDPSPYLTSGQVDVWIDPQRPSDYQVDLSFLPQAGN
jgi:hypothetical protein